MRQRDWFQIFICFLKKLIWGKSTYFDSPLLGHTIKRNCIKFHIVDPEISSIFIFWKRVWDWLFSSILCMIFQEKCFLCHILLTGLIGLYDCPYFSRYWAICVFQLLVMTKKPRQKFKYLENEKSIWGEMKSIFHHF